MIHLIAIANFVLTHPFGMLLSVAAFMVLGFLWFGPIFGNTWAILNGLDRMGKKQMQSRMMPGLILSAVTGFVQAAILGRGLEILYLGSVIHALIIATILWLPFTGLVITMNYAFAHRPWKLAAIDAGYILVALWIMSAILYWSVQ